MTEVAQGTICSIRPMTVADAPALLEMRQRNRSFFEPWEPDRSQELYSEAGLKRDLQQRQRDQDADRRYSFLIVADDGACIGGIVLSNVTRGAFQNATVGYYVAEEHNNKGYATEALRQVLRFAFEEIGLHRVEAGVMDHNAASKRVVAKAGLRRFGFAPRFLKIDGAWRDHHLYAITREDWEADLAAEG